MPQRTFQPARLERIRCAIARDLFRNHLLSTKLTIRLVPKNHPWRVLVSSAVEDLSELTTTSLRPRSQSGQVRAVAAYRSLWLRLASPVFITKFALAYIVIAALSRHVPDAGLFNGTDETIRIFERLGNAGTAFWRGGES